ncbi:MAG: glycosyltransferase [Peptoniphilaceae bacterium]
MKVLITTDLYKPQINGVVTSVLNLYDELKSMGVDVRILTLSKSSYSYVAGDVYYIKSFPVKIYPDVRASLALRDKSLASLIAWKPDIIHTQCEFSTLIFAKIIASKVHCPIVHTYHTMYEYYVRYISRHKNAGKLLVGNTMKRLLKSCDYIIAPTKKVKRSLESYGVKNSIVVIPTGIDISQYDVDMDYKEKMSLRNDLAINKDDKILLNLGRIAEEKNLDELFDNFIALNKLRDDISFVIVGGGPYLEELKAKFYNFKKVYFVGMVDPKEVYKYYKFADLFICASQSETQGLTFIEAMANGLPLLCKYDDCLEGMLKEGYNGYFIKSSRNFVDITSDLLDNKDKINILSKNALKTSVKYSKEFFASSVYNLYIRAIKEYKYIPMPKRQLYKLKSLAKKYNEIDIEKLRRKYK